MRLYSALHQGTWLAEGGGNKRHPIGEIEPIAFVRNRFTREGSSIEHLGIAFTARFRNVPNSAIVNPLGRFVHLNEKELNSINRYANREVAKLCRNRISEFDTGFPELEVSTNEKYKYRYLIHESIVKRLVLTPKLKRKTEFRNIILDKMRGATSVLDASCGDNDLLSRLADEEGIDFLVGNDISWSQIQNTDKASQKIIYTNHNATHLPFKNNAFDVLYCGNTLHHMGSREELELLLASCFRVAKKIIFVEIEKPSATGWIPHILNKYWYGMFLKDVGAAYLTKTAFKSIISGAFGHQAEIRFDTFRNIQGRYLIAEISKKGCADNAHEALEVEEKFFLGDAIGLESLLTAEGYTRTENNQETDAYYADRKGDFIRNRTCLRIRSKKGKCELTFKGKSLALANHYAKVEHNLILESSSVGSVSRLLNSLGFHKYVTVIKDRQVYSMLRDGLTFNVAIDYLENIGAFVEFEILAPVPEWQGKEAEIKNRFKQWLDNYSNFNWRPADLPYRDFVARHLKTNVFKGHALKALLVDFDGTMIPSETLFFSAFRDVAKNEFKYDPSIEEYKEQELSASDGLFKYLQNKTGQNVTRERFMETVYETYEKYFDALLTDDRVLTNLESLQEMRGLGIKLALVTTSKRKFVAKLLEHFGHIDMFDVTVCREDVENLKPNPQAYLFALRKMGLSANDCLAIEDSRRGVTAALAANLHCIGTYGLSLTTEEELASMSIPVFEDIKEIMYVLKYA